MITVAVAIQKGGDGKTTTAQNLGAGLKRYKGARVLFVDLDSQGNLSRTLEAKAGITPDVLSLLRGDLLHPAEAIQHAPGGDVICSSLALAGADQEEALSSKGKEYRLREALEPLSRRYDYCIVDTPPALGILTINALTAADQVVIPVQADDYSVDAIQRIGGTIDTVRQYCNPALTINGILITRYNGRTNVTKYLEEQIAEAAEELGARVYETRIRECAYIKEAKVMREDIFAYATRCNAAKDYRSFIDEFTGGKQNG